MVRNVESHFQNAFPSGAQSLFRLSTLTIDQRTHAAWMLLPLPLLLSLLVLSAHAQLRTPLGLNDITLSASHTSFTIPTQDQGELTISIALCSPSSPQFFITNNTESTELHEIILQDGLGNWKGLFPTGGVLDVKNLPPGASFEVGVSTSGLLLLSWSSSLLTGVSGPLHEILPDYPLFGDSTSNQALIFSPVLALPPPLDTPTYPNFTFLSANPAPPTPSTSGSMPDTTLIAFSTVNRPLLWTACFLNSSSVSASGTIVNSSLWLRDPEDGWRTEWLLSDLNPQTNYTAFVVQDAHKVSGPIFFVTKSASFLCTLAHALPFCPSTAYAVPLSPPSSSSTNNFPIYDTTNVPQDLFNQTINTLTNFTISLSTFACGSDMYSPLVGCDHCQREYRRWLCANLFPRCSEPSPENLAFITPNPKSMGIVNAGPGPTQAVFSALLPVPSQPATTDDGSPPYIQTQHMRLLPCIEMCTAVDRACPPFLQFRCPKNSFNGASTYGFGYIDGADGTQNGGVVTSAQDRWGNVWCNAGWKLITENEWASCNWKDRKLIHRNENRHSTCESTVFWQFFP